MQWPPGMLELEPDPPAVLGAVPELVEPDVPDDAAVVLAEVVTALGVVVAA